MDPDEAERLCDELADLASAGPSRDPAALVKARALLREATQFAGVTAHVREQASLVERALSGWLDAEEQHVAVLKGYRSDIDALIDRLHVALREASLFRRR